MTAERTGAPGACKSCFQGDTSTPDCSRGRPSRGRRPRENSDQCTCARCACARGLPTGFQSAPGVPNAQPAPQASAVRRSRASVLGRLRSGVRCGRSRALCPPPPSRARSEGPGRRGQAVGRCPPPSVRSVREALALRSSPGERVEVDLAEKTASAGQQGPRLQGATRPHSRPAAPAGESVRAGAAARGVGLAWGSAARRPAGSAVAGCRS